MTAERMAGRELDAEIAVLMGGRWQDGDLYSHVELPTGWLLATRDGDGLRIYENALPNYSTSIADAWLVVEKMGERGFTTDIEWKGVDREYAGTAEVSMRKELWTWGHALGSAPLAICLASLAALRSAHP